MRRADLIAALALGLALDAGARAQNLLANPDFDQGLNGWVLYAGTSVGWLLADESLCPQSGSAHGHTDLVPSGTSVFALGQCIPAGALPTVAASSRYEEGTLVNGLALYFHQTMDCSDTVGLGAFSTPVGPSPGAWASAEIPETVVPPGTLAIRLEVGGSHLAGAPIDIEIDRVYLGEFSRVFAEDFEADDPGTSDPCRWSSTSS